MVGNSVHFFPVWRKNLTKFDSVEKRAIAVTFTRRKQKVLWQPAREENRLIMITNVLSLKFHHYKNIFDLTETRLTLLVRIDENTSISPQIFV